MITKEYVNVMGITSNKTKQNTIIKQRSRTEQNEFKHDIKIKVRKNKINDKHTSWEMENLQER